MLPNGAGSWSTGVGSDSGAVRSTTSTWPLRDRGDKLVKKGHRRASGGVGGLAGRLPREACTRLPSPPVEHNREMSKPVTKATTIVTEDGVPIDAVHLPGDMPIWASWSRTGSRQNWQRPGGVEGRHPAEPVRRRGQLRLPRPRPVRRVVHDGRPGDQGRRRGRGLRPRARLRQDRHRRLLHGRLDRAAARRPARRRRRRRLGQRARPLVLPGHRAHAAGALRHREPGRPDVRAPVPGHHGSAAAAGTRCPCRPPTPRPRSRRPRC